MKRPDAGAIAKRGSMLLRAVLIGCLLCIATGSEVLSEEPSKTPEAEKRLLYEWTDDTGVVHLTDGLGKVPREFRDRATVKEQSSAEKREANGQQRPVAPPFSVPYEISDESLRSAWQQRMAAAKNRRAAAETRYRDLLKVRDSLQEQWGYGLYGYTPEAARRLEELDVMIAQTKREMDAAEENVRVTIPEEARKAGIPPGWLRE